MVIENESKPSDQSDWRKDVFWPFVNNFVESLHSLWLKTFFPSTLLYLSHLCTFYILCPFFFGWLSAAAWSRCSALRDVGMWSAFSAALRLEQRTSSNWPNDHNSDFPKSSEAESHPGRECWFWLGHFRPLMTLIHGHFSGVDVRMIPVPLARIINGAIWLRQMALKLSAWCGDNEASELCTIRMTWLTSYPVVRHAGGPNRRIFYHLCFRPS